ncbi:anaerobic ribonucleoside-triphosphate reductase activating protein [Desulfatitalea tepidiphila]|uniref:anaerobic ribonucleoside-triphosphate reductase activating protein n=1 Tax=Desulfatitalea tepidiphila TaxID=1185843 RepID=UPI0006B53212|nr:anaerobic ribonucleoside-triphosphate reductase activating protein [Desulfatitalea tepidiphila]
MWLRRPIKPVQPADKKATLGSVSIMNLAGLQKTSLIDYPGRVSCVVFVTGCNFTCPFCHNGELARGEWPSRLPLDRFIEFLTPRRKLLDGVVISGGEPTLHPHLADLCRAVRRLHLRIKLDTNGSRPDVLARLFDERLVDYVAMDIKTPIASYHPALVHEDITAHLRRSIQLIMQTSPDYEFRTTCVRPFVDAQRILDMARAIQGARRYVLQSFRPQKMLQPDFFETIEPVISPAEIHHFRELSSPLVENCVIRTEHD